MIFQQILLSTNSGEVPEPVPGPIPSGDPVIIDLSFPGDPSLITSAAVYTFLQDVKFFDYTEYNLFGAPFSGSTAIFNGNTGGQINFHLTHSIDGPDPDGLDIILAESAEAFYAGEGYPNAANIQNTSDGSPPFPWFDAHRVSDGYIFFAGEQLFFDLYYANGSLVPPGTNLGTCTDIEINLVGVAL